MVLSAGVGSGHNSAAEAIRESCAGRPDVEAVDVLDVLDVTSALYRDLLDKGYFALVEGAPWLVSLGYDISDQPFKRRGPLDPWSRANAMPALRRLKKFRPTVVICTHFLPAQLISAMILRGALDARTAIVTTDYDFQGLWLASAFHRLYLAREESRVQLGELGIPLDRLVASGIPVRAQSADAASGDGASLPLLVVSAGASGGSYAASVVRQVRRVTSPMRAVVVCGRNEELRREVESLTAGDARFTVTGFTDHMPELLLGASLFIGKPGGLSASECMAAGLPMVLTSPIPGQEVRNGDYLIEEGAAVRCTSTTTIGWKIDQILSTPGRLDHMRGRAHAVGRPAAADDIVDDLLASPASPLIITRNAQKSLLELSESELSARDVGGDRSLVTLVVAETGASLALLGRDELSEISEIATLERTTLRLDEKALNRIGQRWGARRLVKRLLGDAATLTLAVRPSSDL
jgi:processive 1,2-diacylglycerol beta-glucosyltransferase